MGKKRIDLFEIQDLFLHEEIEIDNFTRVMRVPGGLIYKSYDIDKEKYYSDTFVPFDKFHKEENL